jgi:hypothetical protein
MVISDRPPRYLWSTDSDVYHDRSELTEQCNTDQLKDRNLSDVVPPGKRPCGHCCQKETTV